MNVNKEYGLLVIRQASFDSHHVNRQEAISILDGFTDSEWEKKSVNNRLAGLI